MRQYAEFRTGRLFGPTICDMTTPQQPQFEIQVPDEIQGGVYANIIGVWHTPYDFTLDFAVTQQPRQDDDGTVVVPARVVARVKIPTAQIFELIKALNMNMTIYEQNVGPIKQPGPDEEPPMFPPDGG